MINFFSETTFQLEEEDKIRHWLFEVAAAKSCQIDALNYIFCDDSYLLQINREFLKHDDLTDIITFDYSEKRTLKADVFISIERVRENASIYSCPFEMELGRVIVHGLLHLMGYKDKTEKDSTDMRNQEDWALSLESFAFSGHSS